MATISWNDFKKVDLRIGTILKVDDFPEAIKPAYQVEIDLGEKIGIKHSSAQITGLYTKEELIGKQVIVVVNLPSKKIGSFTSECLITGFYRNKTEVVLATSDIQIKNGTILL